MLIHRLIVTTVAVTVLLLPVGAAAPQQPAAPQPASAPQPPARAAVDGEYRIGSEDELEISVWNNTALSRLVLVRPDGKISLPLINDVQAAGLTAMQLRGVLAKRLTEYMPNPEVSVIIRDIRSCKVSVIGEVLRPGRYEFRSQATVLDLLAQAGSFSNFASRGRMFVLRRDGATMKRIPFDYKKVIAADGEGENFFVQPGDIVVVP
jgi:polysaccharide export outer membrane protein